MLCSSLIRRRLGLVGPAVALGLAAAALAGTAQAVLLWDDPFLVAPGQYTLGNVAGQSGGVGTFFNNPWQGVNPADASADDQLVFASSLSKPGQIMPSLGG